MADIHVRFKQGEDTFIYEDLLRLPQDEYVHWHFDTRNTAVAKVRIEFEDTLATFFERPGQAPHWIKKDIDNGQIIWGKAPHYFQCPPHQIRNDKYTIEAFDANDVKLEWATLDPTIRTEGP